MAEDDQIDTLLARYLELLDSYTNLRTELSELQSSVYQSLARANFSAERGVRYGQDFYDERMQASKVVSTIYSEDGLPEFDLVDLHPKPTPSAAEIADMEVKLEEEEKVGNTEPPEDSPDHEKEAKSETTKQPKSKDPLRWFGILNPHSLRQAQSSASQLVEAAVKLSRVDAEMRGVEIEIRRARKRKAKNEKPSNTAQNVEEDRVSDVQQQTKHETAKVNRGGGCGRVLI